MKTAQGGALKKQALESIGAEFLARVKMGFARGEDPYGVMWMPLAHREGQPLRDTGRLQNSFGVNVGSDSITIGAAGSNVFYGAYHQQGFRTRLGKGKSKPRIGFTMPWVPPRPMLPDDRGFPPRWRENVRKILLELLEKVGGNS